MCQRKSFYQLFLAISLSVVFSFHSLIKLKVTLAWVFCLVLLILF